MAITRTVDGDLVSLNNAINGTAPGPYTGSSLQDGDTCIINPGTWDWTPADNTSGLTITKGITIRGQTTVTGDHLSGRNATTHFANYSANDQTIIREACTRPVGSQTSLIQIQLTAANSVCSIGNISWTQSPNVIGNSGGAGFFLINSPSGETEPVGKDIPNLLAINGVRFHHLHLYGFGGNGARYFNWSGWVYGVVDHCWFQEGNQLSVTWHNFWMVPGMTTAQAVNGMGSWADYPYFGSGKFIFFEDNAIEGVGATALGQDAKQGGRYVSRYNLRYNCVPTSHGTSAGIQSGVRAIMQYNDDIYFPSGSSGGSEQRSGVFIGHDNTYSGSQPSAIARGGIDRAIGFQAGDTFSSGGGHCWMDQNATDKTGTTPVADGQPGTVLAEFTVNASVNGVPYRTVDVVTGGPLADFTGCSLVNWSQILNGVNPDGLNCGFIVSNTGTSISYNTYSAIDCKNFALATPPNNYTAGALLFLNGETARIYKPIACLHQMGRGKGDLMICPVMSKKPFTITIANPAVVSATGTAFQVGQAIYFYTTGALPAPLQPHTPYYVLTKLTTVTFTLSTDPNGSPISTLGGSQSGTHTLQSTWKRNSDGLAAWPGSQQETCLGWNNIHNGVNQVPVVTNGYPTILIGAGKDIYNIGTGVPVNGNGIANEAFNSLHYNAARNGGTAYTADFQYPHPLVSTTATGRIISLTGTGLDFGNVTIGTIPPTGNLRVRNLGDTLLTVNFLTYPAGFTGQTTGFTIMAGSFFDITVSFTPLQAIFYFGNIVVASDATSGNSSISCSGTGINAAGSHRKQARDSWGF